MASFATVHSANFSPSNVRSASVTSTSKPSGVCTQKRLVSRMSCVLTQSANATTTAFSLRHPLQDAHGCNVHLRAGRRTTPNSAKNGSLTVHCGPYPPVDEGNIHHIYSEHDFECAMKAAGDRLVVIDVSKRYCGPCKLIYPTFLQLSEDRPNVTFLRLLGDYNEDTKVRNVRVLLLT